MVWEELSEEQQEEKKMFSPWFFTATRFFMIVANKTLKQKQSLLSFRWRWNFIGTSDESEISPRLFDGEAVDSQNPAQFIVGAVDDVLLLLVIQLLLDDVLAQVEHHL